jgi:hypothetical protein
MRGRCRLAQTRDHAPSPGLQRNPTSPRAAGKGKNSASLATDWLPDVLITAYRDGLGLVPVILIAGESCARLLCSGEEPALTAGEAAQARWWCKSAQQGEWLVQTAMRAAQRSDADPMSRYIAPHLGRAVLNAAKRLGITLRSDEEIARDAVAVIARLEQEIAAQQRGGALKSVNRGYRDYRLAASARGEKVLRYADWMERYKAKLVRDIAHNLRSR